MTGESPYERVRRLEAEDAQLREMKTALAKRNMRYALLRISARRWAIVRYDGMSFHGDWKDERTPVVHSVNFVEGYRSVPWDDAVRKLRELDSVE